MKHLLITWWLGYIWSHAVVEFEKAGYQTVIVDNLSNSKLEILSRIEKILWYKPKFYKIDLSDKENLEQVFQENNFDGIIHFAWLKAVWESCIKPIMYFQNNITWSLNLFELMNKYWVKNIIFSSSATVYDLGITDDLSEDYQKIENDLFEVVNWDVILKRGLKETDLTWNTTNPYWRTKYLLEEILKDLAKFADFNVIALRYFNPIWAHPSWFLWEDPNWIPNNLMPYIMKVLKWELKEVKVFWWNYPTKDWTWVRDYIDIIDLIDWHIKGLKKILKEITEDWSEDCQKKYWKYEVYNLWVWKWLSVLEIIKLVEEVSWKKVPYKIVERRSWDLATVWCNSEKANKILNWKANNELSWAIKRLLKFNWLLW